MRACLAPCAAPCPAPWRQGPFTEHRARERPPTGSSTGLCTRPPGPRPIHRAVHRADPWAVHGPVRVLCEPPLGRRRGRPRACHLAQVGERRRCGDSAGMPGRPKRSPPRYSRQSRAGPVNSPVNVVQVVVPGLKARNRTRQERVRNASTTHRQTHFFRCVPDALLTR
eukprot:gene14993-biopygen9205